MNFIVGSVILFSNCWYGDVVGWIDFYCFEILILYIVIVVSVVYGVEVCVIW